MDPWDHRHHHHPSFSSTLLDQIYRSIDDSSSTNSDVSTTKKNHHVEKIHRRTIAEDFVRSRNHKILQPVFFKHSSSSSSDSSGFSSSESDSFSAISHPKPIRTTVERFERPSSDQQQQHNSFLRTKSKALKMYNDLKKVKQPISPGGRVATFLNSLFTGAAGNKRKPNKINTSSSSAATTTTCSSASSFSRSCLSKTPSSSEKSKRSVRFCSVVDDERESNRNHKNFEIRVMEENRRVMEAAKELLRTYQKNKDDVVVVNISAEEEDDDDDDAVSCASSDLFELENLSAIGIDKYREELPVYETTRFNNYRLN